MRLAGARVVQRSTAGQPAELGDQDDTVVDLYGPPLVDVQQQAVQRTADEFGIGPAGLRARVEVVVVAAVDPTAQKLLVTVHAIQLSSDH